MGLEEIKNYINDMRRATADRTLDEGSVYRDPFDQFAVWFEEAVQAQILDPFAMILSTVSEIGYPSSRTVYMRDISDKGLVFYTNYGSQKGREIIGNPYVSLLFLWNEIDRQVRISGKAVAIPAKMSDDYFASRPRDSQIGAWSSQQSVVIETRDELMKNFAYYEEKFRNLPVPRPDNWGGFLVSPEKFEFWQGRPNRLHDRILYSREGSDAAWMISRLSP